MERYYKKFTSFYSVLILILCLMICIHPLYGKRPGKRCMQTTFPANLYTKTCPEAAELLLKPQYKTLIIIDPGHGGRDFGTFSSKTPKYQEKFITLTTSRMVKTFLEKMGYKVSMTRSSDVFIPLEERSAFANKRNPKLFVSVHFNSAPNKLASGIEIFYYQSTQDKSRSEKSKFLAHSILKRILANTKAASRGIKHGNLAVIRETTMPAVLIEGGFLTNEDEVVKIKDAAYLKKLSWGIAQGIQDYLSK